MHILTPRRSQSERAVRRSQIDYQKVLKYIKNNFLDHLILEDTPLTKLPRIPVKIRSLWLENSKIIELPPGLKIYGNLDLRKSGINQIPSTLWVGGSIYLQNTPLSEKYTKEEIRQLIQDKGGYVKGKIYV